MKKITELPFATVAELFHKAFAVYAFDTVWDISFTSCGEIYIHRNNNENVFKVKDNPTCKIGEDNKIQLVTAGGVIFNCWVLTPTEFVSNNPIIKRAIEAQK